MVRSLDKSGFDTANPKFKVGLEHYMELYCVLVLGNLDIRMEAAFWVKVKMNFISSSLIPADLELWIDNNFSTVWSNLCEVM